jgi:hypothetical protein
MTGIDPRPNVIHTGRNGDDVVCFSKQEICQSNRKIDHGVSDRPYPISNSAVLRCPRSYRGGIKVSIGFTLSYLKDLNLQANRYESQEDIL